MTDFFGYTRMNPGQFVYSSDYAAVYFANAGSTSTGASDRAGLVQSSAVSYQHRVEPRFEAGSSELYWCAGQSSGAVTLGRLVGDNGFLYGIKNTSSNPSINQNGALGTVEFKVGLARGTGAVGLHPDVLTMNGCVLQGVAFSTSVGALEVSEALTIQVAVMEHKPVSSAAGLNDGVLGNNVGLA